MKKLISTILIMSFMVSLVACGNKETPNPNNQPENPGQITEIETKPAIDAPNSTSSEAISKYMDSSYYSIRESIHTEYGDVLYVFLNGGPHASKFLTFISNDGKETLITPDIVYTGPFSQLPCNDISLSLDGKKIEFNVKLEAVDTNSTNKPGTYLYSFDLSTGTVELQSIYLDVTNEDHK